MIQRYAQVVMMFLLFVCLPWPANAEQITISGQVLGPDDQPVAHCRVLAFYYTPERESETAEVVSDATGSFSFTLNVWDVVRSVSVVAAKEPLALDWASGGDGEEVTLRLDDSPATCTGTVLGSEGNAVVAAEVSVRTLMRPDESSNLPRSLHLREESFLSDTTDEEGRFEIAGLPAETQVGLTVAAEGWARLTSYRQPITKRGLRFVVMPESTISGQITHNGQPVADVKVHCFRQGPYGSGAEAASAEDGTYHLKQLDYGLYYVRVEPPEGLTAKPLERIKVNMGEHIMGADIELSPGGLVQGIVTEAETGRAISGVRMGAQNLFGPVITDETGVYSMRLPTGKTKVYCLGGGSPVMEPVGERQREVEVVAGETVTGVDFALRERQPEMLRGQVLLPDGQPAAGVQIAVMGGYWGPPMGGPLKVSTDAEGRFELEKGPPPPGPPFSVPGLHLLGRDVDRGLVGLATASDAEEAVQIRLAQGAYLLGEIVDAEGKTVPDVAVRVSVSVTRDGGHIMMISLPMRAATDDQGRLRVGPLPPGVALMVRPGEAIEPLVTEDTWQEVREITLDPGEERELPTLTVNLEGRSVRGWVGDEEQQPVEGAIVFGVGEQQYREFGEPVYADERGYFQLTGLPMQGKVTIVAVHPTKPLFAATETDPDWGFRPGLILRPVGSASGQVLDEQGQPVSDVYVDVSGWFGSRWMPEELRLRLHAAGFTTETYTDDDGKWGLKGLIGGIEYRISAHVQTAAGTYGGTTFTAQAGETVPVEDIVLKPRE